MTRDKAYRLAAIIVLQLVGVFTSLIGIFVALAALLIPLTPATGAAR